MLARCTVALANADGGRTVALTEGMRAAVLARVEAFGQQQALRCLALACRTMSGDHRQVKGPYEPAGLKHPPPHCLHRMVVCGRQQVPGAMSTDYIQLCRMCGACDSL